MATGSPWEQPAFSFTGRQGTVGSCGGTRGRRDVCVAVLMEHSTRPAPWHQGAAWFPVSSPSLPKGGRRARKRPPSSRGSVFLCGLTQQETIFGIKLKQVKKENALPTLVIPELIRYITALSVLLSIPLVKSFSKSPGPRSEMGESQS